MLDNSLLKKKLIWLSGFLTDAAFFLASLNFRVCSNYGFPTDHRNLNINTMACTLNVTVPILYFYDKVGKPVPYDI